MNHETYNSKYNPEDFNSSNLILPSSSSPIETSTFVPAKMI